MTAWTGLKAVYDKEILTYFRSPIAYFVIALMVYGINLLLHLVSKNQPFNYLFATILLFAFIVFVMRIEKKELQSIFQK